MKEEYSAWKKISLVDEENCSKKEFNIANNIANFLINSYSIQKNIMKKILPEITIKEPYNIKNREKNNFALENKIREDIIRLYTLFGRDSISHERWWKEICEAYEKFPEHRNHL